LTAHSVLIAGGGPTGKMLAAELTLAGADVAVVERRARQEVESSRAGGIQARTVELLDQRGILDRFLAEGKPFQNATYAGIRLNISDIPSRHPYGLQLWQKDFERILAGWVDELEVPYYREREVTGFTQDDAGVDVQLSDGGTLRAEYLVGCDGGRSVVRKTAGIEFPGQEATSSHLIAEVEMDGEPEFGIRRDHKGTHALGPLDDGRIRLVVREEELGRTTEPTLRELSEALIAVRGTDYGLRRATWISWFTDAIRQAASYRDRRVLLAGDAAHVHSPVGGQGLNNGVQDAVNLGWKLAQVARGTAPESLLDSYQAERHPAMARMLKNNLAQELLMRSEPRADALRDNVAELLAMEEPRRRYGAMMCGLDIHYDLGPGHPLLGRRMPDLDLVTADGPQPLYSLLHRARPVLLNLGEPGRFDLTPWAGRVQLAEAKYAGPWQLPALGEVAAPAAVLIRPDGHVAWVGDLTDPGLTEPAPAELAPTELAPAELAPTELALPDALTRWFGPPAGRPL
jgi:2-polyprenyl-6-methoxyphenol hydroxylase-like FAD-dependent oxidoreductase